MRVQGISAPNSNLSPVRHNARCWHQRQRQQHQPSEHSPEHLVPVACVRWGWLGIEVGDWRYEEHVLVFKQQQETGNRCLLREETRKRSTNDWPVPVLVIKEEFAPYVVLPQPGERREAVSETLPTQAPTGTRARAPTRPERHRHRCKQPSKQSSPTSL